MNTPYLIADIGSNWRRYDNEEANFTCAVEQIKKAAQCGVDAVKFQLFTNKELYGYDLEEETPYALPRAWLHSLAQHAKEANIDFMCTAFSEEGIEFVDPYVPLHKLASSEFPHVRMIEALMKTKKPVLVSTGGAGLEEIEALHAKYGGDKVIFMECVAAYPATWKDYRFGWGGRLIRGLSDHTLSNTAALLAIARGVKYFEKHFDGMPHLCKTADSPVSIYPPHLYEYCLVLKQAHLLLSKEKTAAKSELDMVNKYRRRLKIIRKIKAGEKLVMGENYGIFRSLIEDTKAAPPSEWQLFEGKVAARALYITDSLNREAVVWNAQSGIEALRGSDDETSLTAD